MYSLRKKTLKITSHRTTEKYIHSKTNKYTIRKTDRNKKRDFFIIKNKKGNSLIYKESSIVVILKIKGKPKNVML